MVFLVAPYDAEAPASWMVASQDNLMATVQVAGRDTQINIKHEDI